MHLLAGFLPKKKVMGFKKTDAEESRSSVLISLYEELVLCTIYHLERELTSQKNRLRHTKFSRVKGLRALLNEHAHIYVRPSNVTTDQSNKKRKVNVLIRNV